MPVNDSKYSLEVDGVRNEGKGLTECLLTQALAVKTFWQTNSQTMSNRNLEVFSNE